MNPKHEVGLGAFVEALDHLDSALDLLDGASAPAQIGAHVDLARHALSALIASIERQARPKLENLTRH